MTQLADDIARIAALRGRPVNYYTDPAIGAWRTAHVLNANLIAAIFTPTPYPFDDLRAYDALPPTSRRFLSESTLQLNAMAYASALCEVPSETSLITALQAHMPGQVKAWLLKHYGRSHPALRRLP